MKNIGMWHSHSNNILSCALLLGVAFVAMKVTEVAGVGAWPWLGVLSPFLFVAALVGVTVYNSVHVWRSATASVTNGIATKAMALDAALSGTIVAVQAQHRFPVSADAAPVSGEPVQIGEGLYVLVTADASGIRSILKIIADTEASKPREIA